MYERYCAIRDLRRYKDADVARLANVTKSTFTDWKNGRSEPKKDKLNKIATALNVTPEYLTGNSIVSVCPVCGFGNNPLSESSNEEHDKYHEKFLKAKEKFPPLIRYPDIEFAITESTSGFNDKKNPYEEKLHYLENYFYAKYSELEAKCGYEDIEISFYEYVQFILNRIEFEKPDKNYVVDYVYDKYHIEAFPKNYSKSEQFKRITRYYQKINNIISSANIELNDGLSKKDEKDISKKLTDILESLELEQDALMFDGQALDDTTRELLKASLENSLKIGKINAKEKFTPKKYKKD